MSDPTSTHTERSQDLGNFPENESPLIENFNIEEFKTGLKGLQERGLIDREAEITPEIEAMMKSWEQQNIEGYNKELGCSSVMTNSGHIYKGAAEILKRVQSESAHFGTDKFRDITGRFSDSKRLIICNDTTGNLVESLLNEDGTVNENAQKNALEIAKAFEYLEMIRAHEKSLELAGKTKDDIDILAFTIATPEESEFAGTYRKVLGYDEDTPVIGVPQACASFGSLMGHLLDPANDQVQEMLKKKGGSLSVSVVANENWSMRTQIQYPFLTSSDGALSLFSNGATSTVLEIGNSDYDGVCTFRMVGGIDERDDIILVQQAKDEKDRMKIGYPWPSDVPRNAIRIGDLPAIRGKEIYLYPKHHVNVPENEVARVKGSTIIFGTIAANHLAMGFRFLTSKGIKEEEIRVIGHDPSEGMTQYTREQAEKLGLPGCITDQIVFRSNDFSNVNSGTLPGIIAQNIHQYNRGEHVILFAMGGPGINSYVVCKLG